MVISYFKKFTQGTRMYHHVVRATVSKGPLWENMRLRSGLTCVSYRGGIRQSTDLRLDMIHDSFT